VGGTPGKGTYTLYNLGTNQVEFKTVYYGNSKGFQNQGQKKQLKSNLIYSIIKSEITDNKLCDAYRDVS
jgi:hypothetical protein